MDVKTLELKSIKHKLYRSVESCCYSASVYLNGKKAITVSNEGEGGCDDQHEIIPDTLKAIDDYLKTQHLAHARVINGEVLVRYHCLEKWCSQQVIKHLYLKEAKSMLNKHLRNKIIYLFSGRICTLPIKQSCVVFNLETAAIQARAVHGEDLVILNFLPYEDALDIYEKSDYFTAEGRPFEVSRFWVSFMPEFNKKMECTNTPKASELPPQ